ncbi:MAG: LTA synthase family protein [Muribaculaceae bacterium]|nr:LTA synthase family protein [Muribaculaceae bacterium]
MYSINDTLQSIKRSPVGALVCNLLLVYILFTVTRIIFVCCNTALYSDHITAGYMLSMLAAGLRFDTTAILYLNCWMLLAFLLPLHVKERAGFYRVMRWIFVVVNFIGISANLCDCAYFPFTGRRTTWSVLQEFGGEGNMATILLHESVSYWYLFIVGAAMCWVLWKCFVSPDERWHERFKAKWRYYLAQAAALAVAAVLTLGGMRGGFTTAVRPITISNANQYVTHAVDAGIVLNTPFSIMRTMGKKAFVERDYMTMEEAAKVYSPVHMPADTAQFRPMNVVVLILESFGKQASARGFMPTIDSLAVKGRSFEYSYANGRKSIDGMPSVLASIPSFVEPFFLTPASLNDLSGLAGELSKNKGYTSAFFHGAENGSMGFQAFARSSGFQQYYGRTEYNQDPRYHGDDDFDGTWAIWDEEFLQYYCDKMSEMKQPFMTSVFTASSHSPYRMPDRYKGKFKEGPHPLYACISYSDQAVKRFFEKASKQPWFNNTIFVITADHATAADDPEYITDLGHYKVPVIFYVPSMPELSGSDSTRIVSQIDIMPTVLGLLGYDRSYVAFGQDALKSAPESTYAINYLPGSNWFQYLEGDWMLQFDGDQVVHAYRFKEDTLQKRDLCGKHPANVEKRMKSIIQQYMYRMNHNDMIIR